MTLEEVQKLNDEELRIMVAELIPLPNIGHIGNGTLIYYYSRDGITRDVPNYPQDLNAMHEAESTIPAWNTGHKPNSHSYSIVLTRILFAENKQRMTHNATARQRAEAFVLTLDSDSTKGV